MWIKPKIDVQNEAWQWQEQWMMGENRGKVSKYDASYILVGEMCYLSSVCRCTIQLQPIATIM